MLRLPVSQVFPIKREIVNHWELQVCNYLRQLPLLEHRLIMNSLKRYHSEFKWTCKPRDSESDYYSAFVDLQFQLSRILKKVKLTWKTGVLAHIPVLKEWMGRKRIECHKNQEQGMFHKDLNGSLFNTLLKRFGKIVTGWNVFVLSPLTLNHKFSPAFLPGPSGKQF